MTRAQSRTAFSSIETVITDCTQPLGIDWMPCSKKSSTFPDLSEVVKFKMEVIAYFYKKFSKRAIIGRTIDAFVLRKQLP